MDGQYPDEYTSPEHLAKQPDDLVGTIRVEPLGRAIAVRGYAQDSDERMWYVINTSGHGIDQMPDLTTWPIVHPTAA